MHLTNGSVLEEHKELGTQIVVHMNDNHNLGGLESAIDSRQAGLSIGAAKLGQHNFSFVVAVRTVYFWLFILQCASLTRRTLSLHFLEELLDLLDHDNLFSFDFQRWDEALHDAVAYLVSKWSATFDL